MKVRKTVRGLHRDFGYFFAFLVIIYSVSGIAVNHVNDWNPNYIIEKVRKDFTPYTDSTLVQEEIAAHIADQLGIKDSLNSLFLASEDEIDLFFQKVTVTANFREGKALVETVTSRPVIRLTNFLHLNVPKKLWTWIADFFALVLIYLAISGLFMLKGKNGFKGRGKWFFIGGVLLPIIIIILYY